MFKIYDGRNQFYQWDIDRKLIVGDATITEVHFCNRTDDCSLVCETYLENGLKLVNVPNILLQTDWRINVYAYDKAYTKFCDQFDVVKRSKPADYVYKETEIKNYDDLAARVDEIEKNGISDEAVGTAVERYMDEHGIQVDLTGYATEEFVNEKIEEIEHPTTDLTNYYTKTEVDKAITEAQLSGGDVDLSDYYTKSETDDAIQAAIDAIEIPEGGGGSGEGGSVSVDGTTIVQNEDGTISATTPIKAGVGHCSIVSDGATSGKGDYTIAIGGGAITGDNHDSIAIGSSVYAIRPGAIAIGNSLQTYRDYQTVIGRYNATNYMDARFIIGSGDAIVGGRNAMVVEDDNNVLFPGTVLVQNGDKFGDFKEVATKAYVDEVSSVSVDGTSIIKNADGSLSVTTPIKQGSNSGSVMTWSAKSAGGYNAMALGYQATAGSYYSVAMGSSASSRHNTSFAIGNTVSTAADYQMVVGKYNAADESANFIIGNGSSASNKKNAMTIDVNDQVHFPGTVVVGADKAEVATKAYVEELLGVIENGTY